MKDIVTPVPPEEVRSTIKKSLENAALDNYTRLSAEAKIEGNIVVSRWFIMSYKVVCVSQRTFVEKWWFRLRRNSKIWFTWLNCVWICCSKTKNTTPRWVFQAALSSPWQWISVLMISNHSSMFSLEQQIPFLIFNQPENKVISYCREDDKFRGLSGCCVMIECAKDVQPVCHSLGISILNRDITHRTRKKMLQKFLW